MCFKNIFMCLSALVIGVSITGCRYGSEYGEHLEILLEEHSEIEYSTETAVVTTAVSSATSEKAAATTKVTTGTTSATTAKTAYTGTAKKKNSSESSLPAVELINMTLPEIIDLMGGVYTAHQYAIGDLGYIENDEVFPGIDFFFMIDDDYYRYANIDGTVTNKKILSKIASGAYTLDGMEVSGRGRATSSIYADMNYMDCVSVLGKISCRTSVGGYAGGDVGAYAYSYVENGVSVCINFELPPNWNYLNISNEMSYSKMKTYNPDITNVVIKKQKNNSSGAVTTKKTTTTTKKTTTTKTTTTTTKLQTTAPPTEPPTTNAGLLTNTCYRSEYVYDPDSIYLMNPDYAARYHLTMDADQHITMSIMCMTGEEIYEFDVDYIEGNVYYLRNGFLYQKGHPDHYYDDLTAVLTMNDDGTFRLKINDIDFDWQFELDPEDH